MYSTIGFYAESATRFCGSPAAPVVKDVVEAL